MNEEEIIENVKQTIEEYEEAIQEEQEKGNVEDVESGIEIKQGIQGLLDLYKKEKERADKLQKENKELQKQLNQLKEVDRQICCEELITKDKYQEILKENAELKNDNEVLAEIVYCGRQVQIPYTTHLTDTSQFISKEIIKAKIKELEKQYKEELRYGRVVLDKGHTIKILEELLGE